MKASAAPAEIAIASGARAFSRSAIAAGETSRHAAFEPFEWIFGLEKCAVRSQRAPEIEPTDIEDHVERKSRSDRAVS
jgi:hypothetical protein